MLSWAGVKAAADLWKLGMAYDRNCHAKITMAPINEKSSLRFIFKGFVYSKIHKFFINLARVVADLQIELY
jgi:hypothetical protein